MLVRVATNHTQAISSRHRQSLVSALEVLLSRLRAIHAAAAAAQLALRCQAAEQDLEIALALRHCVCDELGDRIIDVERLLQRLESAACSGM